MKPGAAMGLSWNTKVLARVELVDLLGRHGLQPCNGEEHEQFAHRVDHAITRDLVVATKPT
jgi:hypothetical protein